MYLTKEKFDEIKRRYETLLVIPGDVNDALSFVQDILEAEADAVREAEPYAVNSVHELEAAARCVFDICVEI